MSKIPGQIDRKVLRGKWIGQTMAVIATKRRTEDLVEGLGRMYDLAQTIERTARTAEVEDGRKSPPVGELPPYLRPQAL